MEAPTTFLTVYGVLQVGLITPLVAWLKMQLPGTFPVQPVLYTAILSFGVCWLLSLWLWPAALLEALIPYAMGGHIATQLTRETTRSVGRTK